MEDQLPIGRIAFAKSVCIDWISEHSKVVLTSLAVVLVLLFWFFQSTQQSSKNGHIDRFLSPYYLEFSQTSALINQEKWDQALQAAKELREKMIGDVEFWNRQDKMIHSGGLLYAYNLIRLAALERKVGSLAGELAALEEFSTSASQDAISTTSRLFDSEAYTMLEHAFQDGTLSIADYIQQRKRELTCQAEEP